MEKPQRSINYNWGIPILPTWHESHVEHSVGFVEDEVFNVLEGDLPLLNEVHQSARSGDEYVTS